MALKTCMIHGNMMHNGADQTCRKLQIGWCGESYPTFHRAELSHEVVKIASLNLCNDQKPGTLLTRPMNRTTLSRA